MWSWDRRYQEKVRKAGLKLRLYERYVDDSNQIAEVPPPNTKYNPQTGKLVKDDNPIDGETDDGRTARVFQEIANHVQDGIVMEEDHPSKNADGQPHLHGWRSKLPADQWRGNWPGAYRGCVQSLHVVVGQALQRESEEGWIEIEAL